MAFDRNDPADLASLKTELTTDPVSVGYDLNGSYTTIANKINDASNNPVPADGVPPLSVGALWDILVTENLASGSQFVMQLLFESTQGLLDDVSDKRTQIAAIDGGVGTKVGLLTRPLSRAEVLFSDLDANGTNEFVTLSVQDLVAAVNS